MWKLFLKRIRGNAIHPKSGKKQVCILTEEKGVEMAKFYDGVEVEAKNLKELKRFEK